MLSLIIGESAIFTIFVVAYVYYIGRSAYGPTPQILDIPIFNTVCLLSSSLTIWLAEHAIERGRMRAFAAWWALTIVLGVQDLGLQRHFIAVSPELVRVSRPAQRPRETSPDYVSVAPNGSLRPST